MSRFARIATVSLILVFAGAMPARAETAKSVQLGIDAYAKGDYEGAARSLRAAEADPALPDKDRSILHTYLGYCEISFGKPEVAKLEFREALILDPALNLDPVQVPPKILEVFNQAKAERAKELAAAGGPPMKPGKAVLLSSVAPGLGQFGSRRRVIGTMWSAAAVGSIGAVIYNQIQLGVAEGYVKDANPAEKAKMRTQADKHELYRNVAVASMAAIWTANVADAWMGARLRNRKEVTVAPLVGPEPGLIFSARF